MAYTQFVSHNFFVSQRKKPLRLQCLGEGSECVCVCVDPSWISHGLFLTLSNFPVSEKHGQQQHDRAQRSSSCGGETLPK